jgi:hypothetical protein
MVIEMSLHTAIQKNNCSNDFTLSKGNNCNYVHYWKNKIKNKIISFKQNIINIWILKIYVFVMFKMKYLINKMQCDTLAQQVWWLDGKVVCLHCKGQRNKPHKLCVYEQ